MKQAYTSLSLFALVLSGCSQTRDPGPASATTQSPNPPIKSSQTGDAEPSTRPEQPQFNGTPVKITVYDPGRGDSNNAVRNARAAFETVERLASSRSPYYELARSKDNPGVLTVSAETLKVVERAVFWTQRSGGAFNCVKNGKPEDVKIGFSQRQVELKPGCELDISGLVIGAAVDAAIDQLKEARIKCAEIEAGPVRYLMGKKEGAGGSEKLLVEIEHPRRQGKELGSLGTTDNAIVHLADSGSYKGPEVDPRDGSPVSGTISVYALARHAVDAQALALTLFVMGPGGGRNLIERVPTSEALIFSSLPDNPKEMHTMITRGMQSEMKWKVKPRAGN
ncbi:MAG: FAD:protein FMN transferase [Planctomycetota bacterium]|nr:FAD:protein FMN transferase [Planctomycetota bacterium]MDA1142938.1 FAD:protein FMN transferase [Planctomycetota bacterium]